MALRRNIDFSSPPPLLIAHCPRCGSKSITFDVGADVNVGKDFGWASKYEIFALCRACHHPTIFVIRLSREAYSRDFTESAQVSSFNGTLNDAYDVLRFIALRDHNSHQPPDFLDEALSAAFKEGAACFSIGCYNAAATMFRLCVDLATRPLLPSAADNTDKQPNEKTRRDLGLRLRWMFESGKLDLALQKLSQCIREDGNDGAHKGNLSKEDAEDILDFTYALLDRLITEPKRLEEAERRREERRKPKGS